ncbi:pyridoxamine 5'-phosphate oxidase family protein [Microbacterium esteraromaticum]|uniref:pyridoxamine 5'-phosphate oxidase family protein n=1 Tax=Microbacterium esteraromaticum TaxID=57043 RepID=UPI000B34F105|nr:pyridoxamine 5'-phosphate oxidase family protein [Microbacterium esteraromaticum]
MNSPRGNVQLDTSATDGFGARSRTIKGAEASGVETLTMKECWRLIRAGSLGRLAITGRDGAPDIYPLNYKVHGGSIYFRSAPGSKLAAIVTHPVAALEIDGKDAGFHWSVVVRGAMRRLSTDQEIHDSGVKRLVSSSPTAKYNYVCIETSSVSGRRFFDRSSGISAAQRNAIVKHPLGAQEPTRSVDDTVMRSRRNSNRALRPLRIPHFPPR